MTIHLRIRIWGSNAWSNPETHTTSASTAPFDLTRLTGGTTYEVEVSLESAFPPVDTVSAIFTTTPATRVSGVDVGSVTTMGATVTVSIAHPEGNTRTVYLRYRDLSEEGWTTNETETDTGTAEVLISRLIPDTKYEVQASLHGAFPATDTQLQRFNTPSAKPIELPTPVPAATPTHTPTPEPTSTPEPIFTPEPTPTSTPSAEPTMTPTPPPPPSPTPLPSLTPTPTATPSHTPTQTSEPKPAETPAPRTIPILTAAPLLSPTPGPTSTPQAEEEKTGTDLALVITVVTLALALTLVVGFFVYRRRMEP